MARTCRFSLPSIAVLACAVVLAACNGGGSTPPPSTDIPAFAVAKLAPQGVLEIPVLRAGARSYADVRLLLAADGSVQVLSAGRPVTTRRPPDAVIETDIQPAEIAQRATPVVLHLRRLHAGRGVSEGVEYEIAGGRWRHLATAGRAATLHSADFDANPQLVATPDDLLVLRSEPGRAHSIPVHLNGRRTRVCVTPHADGTDELALLDRAGNVLAATTAQQPCMQIPARLGMHRLRHTYGGNGARRVLFLRPGATAVAAARPPRAMPQRAAAADPEYWAIGATFALASDPLNNDTVRFQFLTSASNLLTDCIVAWPATAMHIGAFVNAQFSGPQYVYWQAMQLFDTYNLFQPVFASNGRLTGLAGYGCGSGGTFGVTADARTAAVLVPNGTALSTPLTVGHWDGLGSFFELTAGPGGAVLGFPYGFEPNADNVFAPLQRIPSGVTPAYEVEGYGVQLRYRPNGVGTLVQGQAALFNSTDCSGAAMVVESTQLNLLPPGQDNFGGSPGPMGDFRGSLLLGPDTMVTIYAGTGSPIVTPTGANAVRNAQGCLSNALATPTWSARSLLVEGPWGDWSSDWWDCQGCNLANLDFSGHDLTGAKLAGSNLNGAHFTGAMMAGADLQGSTLQGAVLANANLDGANLCNAFLNAPPGTASNAPSAADLTGAYLRNANLSGTNLTGAKFVNASFFSDQAPTGSCTGGNLNDRCAWTGPKYCASAAGATLNNADFSSAYLAGTDFGSATGYAKFGNAILVGASFRSATFSPDPNGAATSFAGAFLMGADFSSATLTNVQFFGAYSQATAGQWDFLLGSASTSFPSFMVMDAARQYCVPPAGPASTCQRVSWNAVALPAAATGTLPLSALVSASSGANLCGTSDPFQPVATNYCFQRNPGVTGGSPTTPPVTPIIIQPLPGGVTS